MTSIRSRLLLTTLAGLLIVLSIGGVVLNTVVRWNLTEHFEDGLRAQAHTLASAIVLDHAELEFEAAGSTNLPAFYRVTLEDGTTFAGAGVIEYKRAPDSPKDTQDVVWAEVELPEDTDGRSVSIAVIPHEEAPSGTGHTGPPTEPLVVVTVAEPLSGLQSSITLVQTSIIVTGVMVLAAAGCFLWWGVRRGLSPMDELAAELALLKSDALEPVNRPAVLMSELSPVYEALDHLLARMRSAFERERRFTDAAAHELATPLAEMRTITDVARRWPEPERLISTVKKAGIVAARMQELIEALLLLSRNPRDIEALSHEPVSVARFVKDELDRQRGTIDDKSIDLRVDLDPESNWMLSEPVATLIVRNLLSNAVEYTPEGGRIEVCITGHDLQLTNTPVELNRSNLPFLFEPFWRADASRSETTHHGLGLALVQHACESCGLTCKATLNDQHLTFTVRTEADDEN